jgi:hypothetical protein
MAKTDEQIIKAIVERMYKRRNLEASAPQAKFTMCYAVSVKAGGCYVGYNMDTLTKTAGGSGKCAEKPRRLCRRHLWREARRPGLLHLERPVGVLQRLQRVPEMGVEGPRLYEAL